MQLDGCLLPSSSELLLRLGITSISLLLDTAVRPPATTIYDVESRCIYHLALHNIHIIITLVYLCRGRPSPLLSTIYLHQRHERQRNKHHSGDEPNVLPRGLHILHWRPVEMLRRS